MSDQPYSEPGITEETRQMYPENYSDKYNKVFKEFIDDIVRPNHIEPVEHNHEILLDELVIIYDAFMTLGGEQYRYNAAVLRAAINVIRAL
jgi:hypothetical protein